MRDIPSQNVFLLVSSSRTFRAGASRDGGLMDSEMEWKGGQTLMPQGVAIRSACATVRKA